MKSRAVGRRNLAGENVRMALTTLWSQKLRSGLTLLGIIIGVATVIAMVSMIQGVNGSVSKQIGVTRNRRPLHLEGGGGDPHRRDGAAQATEGSDRRRCRRDRTALPRGGDRFSRDPRYAPDRLCGR